MYLATAATKTFMDFEAQMSKVKAISGATGNDFQKLKDQAIQLGTDTNFNATEAAEGMENLASAGFKVNDIMKAMPGMLSLAAAGDVDIATASDIASSALNGFGLSADKTTHVADVLAKVAGDTNAGITDTGEAMKYIAPVSHALGISLEETSAAIGLMSNEGIKGSQAGTTLRSALTNLAAPTTAASKVMKNLGMNFFDSSGKMKSLGEVIKILQDKTKGLTQQQKTSVIQTLFGKEAMSGMLALMDQGSTKFNALTKELKTCDGASKDMADTMQDNLKGAIEAMNGSIETAGIKLGEALAPTIKVIAKVIGGLTNAFSALPKPIQQIIANLMVMAIAFGPVMMVMGKFISMTSSGIAVLSKLGSAAKAISKVGSAIKGLSKLGGVIKGFGSAFAVLPGMITPPVLITIGVIALIGFAVYEVIKHWTGFKKFLSGFGTFMVNLFKGLGAVVEFVVKGWSANFTAFGKLLGTCVEAWKANFKAFGTFLAESAEGWKIFFGHLGDDFKSIGKFIFGGLFEGISSMAGKIKDKVASIAKSIKDTFKSVLGIHSPSTVFAEFGVNTGQGYINGIDKMQNPIKNRFVKLANGIKSLGNTKPNFSQLDNIALSGAYGSSGGLSKIGNFNSGKVLNFDPKINLYVTVADTGEKGTAKLTNEVKSMAKSSLKNGLVDFFMNDVIRD